MTPRLDTAAKIVSAGGFLLALASGIGALAWPAGPVDYESTAATGVVMTIGGLIALGLAVALHRGKAPALVGLGLASLVLGMLAWIGFALFDGVLGVRRARMLLNVGVMLVGEAAVVAVIGLQLAQPARRRVARIIRRCTVGVGAVLLVAMPVITLDVLDDPWAIRGRGDLLPRLLGAAALAVVGGLIANMILARVGELDPEAEAERPGRPELDLACPRCGDRQPLRLDGDRCRRCGLRITVTRP
ncbi:MAG: hypothetical protein ACYTG1_00445 [Planctomycetota bacterium]